MTDRQGKVTFSLFNQSENDFNGHTSIGARNGKTIWAPLGSYSPSAKGSSKLLLPDESSVDHIESQAHAILYAYLDIVMAVPFPAALCYGPELQLTCNQMFTELAGINDNFVDSSALTFSDVVSCHESEFELSEAVTNCMTRGMPVVTDNLLAFVYNTKREDELSHKSESYFTWKMVPIMEENGDVSGVFITVTETTDTVLYERRMQVLKELYDATASALILPVFFVQSVSVLHNHCAEDVALFGLYVYENSRSKTLLHRCGFGLVDFPERVAFDPNPALFEQTILDTSSSAVYIKSDADGFRNYIQYDPTRGWSDEIRQLVFLPVMRDNKSVVGVAVIGLNPRRSFDEPYELFLELLGRQLATGIDNLKHIEEASAKLNWEVAMNMREKEELEVLLMEKTKQLKVSENRFTSMAQILPAGLFLGSPEGEIVWANDAWYKLAAYPKDNNPSFWIKSVHPGDRTLVRDSWRRVMQGHTVQCEFRWANKRGDPSNFERWCSSTTSVEIDPETEKILYITGVLTDITERKRAEALQRQRADEAVERRRQQEYFIDAISHEMRNPLSAIIQSCDVVSQKVDTVIKNIAAKYGENQKLEKDELTESAECLSTIQLCTSHMLRIIGDTINLSKMESGLFPINPKPCKPVEVAREVLKMYENEFKNLSITFDLEIGENYKMLGLEVVKMDSRRVMQVLINLVSNSIKILTSTENKHILIRVDASVVKPALCQNSTSFYFPQKRNCLTRFSSLSSSPSKSVPLTSSASSAALTALSVNTQSVAAIDSVLPRVKSYASLAASRSSSVSSSTGVTQDPLMVEDRTSIYIMFSVKDSGPGMDEEQLSTAFQRFTSHFTPRTHVNYGGTGLGLFICRKLVENQGGEITAESKKDEGSEFAFYIKAGRCNTNSNTESEGSGDERSLISGSVDGKPLATFDISQKKILIVEDNVINQKLLERQLKNTGFKTIVANHGQEALDIILSGIKPDCCVMDCEMPVMDGFSAVRKIRELENDGKVESRLPIIALSANARQVHFDRMFEAGSDRYITKPFNFSHLIEVVKELLQSTSSPCLR
ncbi:hypothetical protein V1511DRAFT_507121 [Dipodascopsis uninucleata]